MISFCIPAHDEEAVLPATLRSVHEAARSLGVKYEIVVADDASTDTTADLARAGGARVVSIDRRQIAAARNAAAEAAQGDVFVFLDADTLLNSAALSAMLEAAARGAAGGGCLVRFDRALPWWGKVIAGVILPSFRVLNLVGGACMFASRAAFEGTGGFDEEHYAGEEIYFARAIKRVGRFVVVGPLVTTSGRKFRTFSGGEVLASLVRMTLAGPERATRDRERLGLWYGKRRADPLIPDSTTFGGRDRSGSDRDANDHTI